MSKLKKVSLVDYSLDAKSSKDNSQSLKIGLVFDDSLDSFDGVAQYVKTVGAWLSDNGHQVTYLVGQTKTGHWHGGSIYSLSRNLRIMWAGNRLSMPIAPKLVLIKQIMRQHSFDVLHVQVPYSPFMGQLIINRAEHQTAVIGTFHVFPANKLATLGGRLLKLIYGRSLRRFNWMLSVSSAAADYAKQSFKLDTSVSPNVVDLKEFQSTSVGAAKTSAHIVFLGRLVPRKGAYELLKAFLVLKKNVPEARLTIAGDGPLRAKLDGFVKKNHLADSVSFLGFIDEANKPKLLASADIACFPSLFGESFGIVLIEAMAAGAGVVVGGNNPGYQSVIGERAELLFDPRNTADMVQKLHHLLRDQTLRAELHKWQQAEVKKYDIDKVGPQLVQIYARAIAKQRDGGHN